MHGPSHRARGRSHLSLLKMLLWFLLLQTEHFVIFTNILSPAFLQDKKMPWFFVREGIEIDSPRSFRNHRCLLTLPWSSCTPASIQVSHLSRSPQVLGINEIHSQGWNQLCEPSRELVFNQKKVLVAGPRCLFRVQRSLRQKGWSCHAGMHQTPVSNPSCRLQAGPVAGDVWPAQGESRVWEWVSSAPATAFETALSWWALETLWAGKFSFVVSKYLMWWLLLLPSFLFYKEVCHWDFPALPAWWQSLIGVFFHLCCQLWLAFANTSTQAPSALSA